MSDNRASRRLRESLSDFRIEMVEGTDSDDAVFVGHRLSLAALVSVVPQVGMGTEELDAVVVLRSRRVDATGLLENENAPIC